MKRLSVILLISVLCATAFGQHLNIRGGSVSCDSMYHSITGVGWEEEATGDNWRWYALYTDSEFYLEYEQSVCGTDNTTAKVYLSDFLLSQDCRYVIHAATHYVGVGANSTDVFLKRTPYEWLFQEDTYINDYYYEYTADYSTEIVDDDCTATTYQHSASGLSGGVFDYTRIHQFEWELYNRTSPYHAYPYFDVTAVCYLSIYPIGDLNYDKDVDLTDLAALLGGYGAGGSTYEQGDINEDGTVGLDDLAALLGNYGENW